MIRFESLDAEDEPLGVIIAIRALEIGMFRFAEVLWDDGEICMHDDRDLEVVCAA